MFVFWFRIGARLVRNLVALIGAIWLVAWCATAHADEQPLYENHPTLTVAQHDQLVAKLKGIECRTGVHVFLWTVAAGPDFDLKWLTDHYFEEHDFSPEVAANSVLFVIDWESRHWRFRVGRNLWSVMPVNGLGEGDGTATALMFQVSHDYFKPGTDLATGLNKLVDGLGKLAAERVRTNDSSAAGLTACVATTPVASTTSVWRISQQVMVWSIAILGAMVLGLFGFLIHLTRRLGKMERDAGASSGA